MKTKSIFLKVITIALILMLAFSGRAIKLFGQPKNDTEKYSLVALISQKEKAVVKIGMHNSGEEDQDLGTGFFIDDRGTVITNHHVVAGQWGKGLLDFYIQTIDGEKFEPDSIIGYNPVADVFMFRVKKPDSISFPFLEVVYDDAPKGQEVFLIGHPAEFNWLYAPGVITGYLNDKDSLKDYVFNSEVMPGSSGSPLFDKSGKVIGIAKATYGYTGNFNLATRSSYFKNLISFPVTAFTEIETESSGYHQEDIDREHEYQWSYYYNDDSMDRTRVDDLNVNMRKAENSERFKDFYAALYYYEKAAQIDPSGEDVQMKLCVLYYKTGNYTHASLAAASVLEFNPVNLDALNYLGKCLYEQRKYHKAKKVFKKVLKNDLQNKTALHYIGKIISIIEY